MKTITRGWGSSCLATCGPNIAATTSDKAIPFSSAAPGAWTGPDEIGFDAISEVVFKYEDSLAQMAVISAANRDRIVEDEARWFHQKRCWTVTCDTVEEDLGLV